MSNYLIYTDAAADFPSDFFERDVDLRIIPMNYTVNGEEKEFDTSVPNRDKVCDEFYEALRSGADVKTTGITPYNYVELLTPVIEAGNDILYLCFSSGMSGTYNYACMAFEQLRDEFPDRKLIVVDTLAATQGQGIFVRAALMNRDKGMTIEENEAWLIEKRPYLTHRFLVGNLEYLHKGGRVSAAVAIAGTMLKIKPLLIIDDEGKLQVYSKARGMNAALKKILDGYVKEQGVPDVPKIIHVGHTSMYDVAEQLKKELEAVVDPDTIIDIVNMGPIVGAHCGELISICGWGFHRKEQ